MTYQYNSWRHLVAPFLSSEFSLFFVSPWFWFRCGPWRRAWFTVPLGFSKKKPEKVCFSELGTWMFFCYVVVGREWFGSGWSGNAFLQYVVWEVLRRSRTHYCLDFPSCMFTHAAKVLLNKNMGGMTWNNAAWKTIRLYFCEWLRVFFFQGGHDVKYQGLIRHHNNGALLCWERIPFRKLIFGAFHSQAIKLPTGEKSRRGMARAVARMAAERAAANIQAPKPMQCSRQGLWRLPLFSHVLEGSEESC